MQFWYSRDKYLHLLSIELHDLNIVEKFVQPMPDVFYITGALHVCLDVRI